MTYPYTPKPVRYGDKWAITGIMLDVIDTIVQVVLLARLSGNMTQKPTIGV